MKYPEITLTLTKSQQSKITDSLFNGSGNERVIFLLCGRRAGISTHRLLVHEVIPLPEDAYVFQSEVTVKWKTSWMDALLTKAEKNHLAIVKVHNHPAGARGFSSLDDESDSTIFASIHQYVNDQLPHVSVIMSPCGDMLGRAIHADDSMSMLNRITVIGDSIEVLHPTLSDCTTPEFTRRHTQVFGNRTMQTLMGMSAAIIGCSGTGSPVIEQLVRLGVRKVVLIDPDTVEEKNINRIIHATMDDAIKGRLKVDVISNAIERIGLGTDVDTFAVNICESREAIQAVGECDIIFGCTDSIESRDILNVISRYYLIPYIDMGVRIDADADADANGGVKVATNVVNYIRPDQSSLLSRQAYTQERLEAESMRRTHPELYEERRKLNYIHNAPDVDRPAVASINMFTASLALMEFLARIHPYRIDAENGTHARTQFNFRAWMLVSDSEMGPEEIDEGLLTRLGRGDTEPLLDMIALGEI